MKEIPLSEETEKSDAYHSPQECIAELRRIAEIDPSKVISRNYFRINSTIKESVWNRHFGTFEEFKRQANIIISRHQRRMETDVAKHASLDVFRQFNKEKSGYAEKYLNPCERRFQTIIHATDIHDTDCDPFWVEVFLDTVNRVKPNKIIFGGDLFDLPEFGKYGVDPRAWDVVNRIEWVHNFLYAVRDSSPNSEMILVEGNHEYRLLRHLAESTPAMKAVLSDLHGFTVPKLLGLDDFNVNYISRSDLGTFNKNDIKEEINRNYYIAYDCYLAHHFPAGEKLGFPGAHGHHHRHKVNQHYSPVFGAYEWQQLGCGHKRFASYCAGEQWGMGFLIAHIDTVAKHVLHEYVQIRDNFAVVGGKYYTRKQNV